MTPRPGATRIVAGIDEAGLGPILGPLAMGWSAFRVPAHEADLWRVLEAVVTADPDDESGRLAVADSKVVFTRTERGGRRLERTVLAFLGWLGAPRSGRELLLRTPVPLRPETREIERHPWYALLAGALPVLEDAQALRAAGEALMDAGRARGTALVSGGVAIHPAGALNASYARTQNKARTLWEKTEPILQYLLQEYGMQDLHVTIDRHGGRLHYAELLIQSFPLCTLECGAEGRGGSTYRLQVRAEDGTRRSMTLLFVEKADRVAFPTALASCFAKYGRETCMHAFNAYFGDLQPGLRPTAGYTLDGRRWIEEAAPALERSGVEKAVLIRDR